MRVPVFARTQSPASMGLDWRAPCPSPDSQECRHVHSPWLILLRTPFDTNPAQPGPRRRLSAPTGHGRNMHRQRRLGRSSLADASPLHRHHLPRRVRQRAQHNHRSSLVGKAGATTSSHESRRPSPATPSRDRNTLGCSSHRTTGSRPRLQPSVCHRWRTTDPSQGGREGRDCFVAVPTEWLLAMTWGPMGLGEGRMGSREVGPGACPL